MIRGTQPASDDYNPATPMNAPGFDSLRLTQFSHGGGCGCKIAPALLQQIIAKGGTSVLPAALLVGI